MNLMLGILEHLAAFEYFEAIGNRIPDHTFEQSFKLQVWRSIGQGYSKSCMLNMIEESATLIVENLSENSPIYFSIFDREPLYQIDSLLCSAGENGFVISLTRMLHGEYLMFHITLIGPAHITNPDSAVLISCSFPEFQSYLNLQVLNPPHYQWLHPLQAVHFRD